MTAKENRMTPSPAPQPADGEREVDPWATEPADWTREQAEVAQAELDALELTDPAVRAAAESFDRMVKRVTRRKPTTPASAEPTEGELLAAHELLDWAASMRSTPSARDIARTLASQRAEIVARYDEVAKLYEWALPIVSANIREAAPK